MLEWDDCTIGYRRDRPIFEHFSLTLDESAVIIGPSGSGKSTLMAAMLGLVPYVAGDLRVDGRSVGNAPRLSRQYLSYLPSANRLPSDLTMEEYLTELARLDGLLWSTARRQAQQVADRLHLAQALSRRLGWLSGGMKRRTLLAATLLKPSEWLLVDEATAGLDPAEQRTVLDLLQTESSRRPVMMVTQQLDEIRLFPNRVIILADGKVLFDASSQALADAARSHVFQAPMTALAQAHGTWRPLPESDAIKLYLDQPPQDATALAPTVEDGYFWLLTAKGREHGK